MKKHAQAILQFTGYPLEPMVALQLKKSFRPAPSTPFISFVPFSTEAIQTNGFVYNTTEVDERWFSNYE